MRSSSGTRRRRISTHTSSPPRAATTVKCSLGNSGSAGNSYWIAPNSSSAFWISAGSSWPTMPLTASRVSPRLASSTWPVGDTTYGLSPACITIASPSTLTMAWGGEGTRLIYLRGCTRPHRGQTGRHGEVRSEQPGSLLAAGRTDFVDADQLDYLVSTCLVRRNDPFGPKVLQHPLIPVIGRADVGNRGQSRFEAGNRHRFLGDGAGCGQKPESRGAFGALHGLETDEQLVADEIVVGVRSCRGGVLDANEADTLHVAQPIDQQVREGALAGPRGRIKFERHDVSPSARRGRRGSARGTRAFRSDARRRRRQGTGGSTPECTGRCPDPDAAPSRAPRQPRSGRRGMRRVRLSSRAD